MSIMSIQKTTLRVGAEKPFSALHISDTHIALADERDGARKMDLARSRTADFSAYGIDVPSLFEEQLRYATERHYPVLHTGDLCDFVSLKNLEYARDHLRGVDHFLCAGNHEYSQYVGEAFEDVPYRMQSYALVQAFFDYNLFFDSRVIGGVNFVAVDDGYYRFDRGQLRRLQLEAAKGLPIVLMLHCPLHTDDLYRHAMETLKAPCADLTGTPEGLMRNYDEYRYRQQLADEDTLAFIDYLYSQPAIKAVLSGHLHINYECVLPSGIPQIVTGSSYRNCAREVLFL